MFALFLRFFRRKKIRTLSSLCNMHKSIEFMSDFYFL